MKQTIGFYNAHGVAGFCSNFYEAPIVIDNVIYKTSEHYYQSRKFSFGDPVWERIVAAPTPQEVVQIARQFKPPEDWDNKKFLIMKRAVYNKFYQHSNLAAMLLKTGTATLVEDTVGSVRPDEWWGNGENGEGRNWLGLILMEVRESLKGYYFDE